MTPSASGGANGRGGQSPDRRTGAEIYERLKRDILTFAFRPGERLVELDLCERYEVSRTPIREALRRLEDEGLIVQRDKGGRVVKGLDIAEYEDVYAIRAVLEEFAVRQLADRAEPNDGADDGTASELDIDALQYGWLEGASAQTAELDGSFVIPDERFHLNLARATGNAYLLESMERVHDRLHTIRSFDFTVRERLIRSEEQHIAIGQAIREHDRERAAELMREHIHQSKDEIRTNMLRILSHAYGGLA